MPESEIWKDVVGYEGYYKVSNKGNIYSVERKNSIGKKCGGRMLKPVHGKDGYLRVNMYKNGIMETKLMHRIVAEVFITNCNNYLEINHKDEVKDNNNVNNLEWCTREYNMNHGTRNERAGQTQSKKVKAINITTGEVLTFDSAKEAKSKGYSAAYVACQGVYKSSNGKLIGDGHLHKGYRWSYWEEK